MAKEEWRPVVGHPFYEVSDHGNVRSIDRYCTDKRGGIRFLRGRVLAPRNVNGYLHFAAGGGQGKDVYVHRAVLEAFVGPRPAGMEGCHNDGDRAHNVPSNLRWDTRSNNNRDAAVHGTHRNARKTHCPRGHEYDGVVRNGLDIFGQPKIKRLCRACQSAANLRYRLAKSSNSKQTTG